MLAPDAVKGRFRGAAALVFLLMCARKCLRPGSRSHISPGRDSCEGFARSGLDWIGLDWTGLDWLKPAGERRTRGLGQVAEVE